MAASTIDQLVRALSPQASHRVWVISDLQQAIPEKARRCLSLAVGDFRSLRLPVEQVWYLGDAVEGAALPELEEMCRMQVEMLRRSEERRVGKECRERGRGCRGKKKDKVEEEQAR